MYSTVWCGVWHKELHFITNIWVKKKITGLEEHFIPKLKQVILLDQCVVCTIWKLLIKPTPDVICLYLLLTPSLPQSTSCHKSHFLFIPLMSFNDKSYSCHGNPSPFRQVLQLSQGQFRSPSSSQVITYTHLTAIYWKLFPNNIISLTSIQQPLQSLSEQPDDEDDKSGERETITSELNWVNHTLKNAGLFQPNFG